jgi:uncharacterized phage protein (TIGR01671 family)
MAREILFKAKRIGNGEWVYGNYAFDDTKGERHFIFQNFGFEYEVDKDTICQYTGLTDKNGNKIWENDILDADEVYSLVRFDEESARFVLDDYGIKGCLMEYGFDEDAGGYGFIETNGFDDFMDIAGTVEVIGNIFDNPELLGGADNG